MNGQNRKAAVGTLVVVFAGAALAAAQGIKKEYRFTVGPKALVSVTNGNGPISVKSSPGNQVVVNATIYSSNVEIDREQNGQRIDLVSHLLNGAQSDASRVSYELTVPPDTSLILHSSDGPFTVENLKGDVDVHGNAGPVDVRDVSDGHVHMTLEKGPVTLTNAQDTHIEITSMSEDVHLSNVQDSRVEVNSIAGNVLLDDVSGREVIVTSTRGMIQYTGNFGEGGQYNLTTHSGNIDAFVPPTAAIEVSARSETGKVLNDYPLQQKSHPSVPITANSFTGVTKAAPGATSRVVLHSYSGRIRLTSR
jgi:DUF4097 and DUF4098 domain-containing protein YvlB